MDSRINSLITRGDKLFGDKATLDTLHQEIADNFYVERATFTRVHDVGEEFASHLYTSYPPLVHRELSDAIGGMLRPRSMPWFEMQAEEQDKLGLEAKEWLQWATGVQRRAMYDRGAQFSRATKQGDRDFAAFGQCVVQRMMNWRDSRLLYRTWHLKDVAWSEGSDGAICEIHRRWKPMASQIVSMFPASAHVKVRECLDKEPFKKITCRAVVLKAEDYESPVGKKWKTPWVQLYIDCENKHVMEEVGTYSHGYTIPRWVTPGDTQYAYSPATIIGLPEARLIQAMTLTLLEAGEMAVRPPLIATQDAIREDVNWYPGGITWADVEYDERKGDVLRPISQDKSGLPFGMDFSAESKSMLAAIFYLNKLNMPLGQGGERTAYEVGQMVQEYIRQALPLFEPIEDEYNASICEDAFDGLLRTGAFGAPQNMPRELTDGREIRFRFESPLHDAIERKKAITFLEMKNLIMEAIEIDPDVAHIPKATVAIREAIEGLSTPMGWLRDKDEAEALAEAANQKREMAETAAIAGEAATAAEQMGKASQALQ